MAGERRIRGSSQFAGSVAGNPWSGRAPAGTAAGSDDMATESPEQAEDRHAMTGPPGDVEDETGEAGCLPFELYAPGWRTGWGQAVRDAGPR